MRKSRPSIPRSLNPGRTLLLMERRHNFSRIEKRKTKLTWVWTWTEMGLWAATTTSSQNSFFLIKVGRRLQKLRERGQSWLINLVRYERCIDLDWTCKAPRERLDPFRSMGLWWLMMTLDHYTHQFKGTWQLRLADSRLEARWKKLSESKCERNVKESSMNGMGLGNYKEFQKDEVLGLKWVKLWICSSVRIT